MKMQGVKYISMVFEQSINYALTVHVHCIEIIVLWYIAQPLQLNNTCTYNSIK